MRGDEKNHEKRYGISENIIESNRKLRFKK